MVPNGAEEPQDASAEALDVERAREGDGEAMARLIGRHQAAVARQMWRFTREPAEHRELVQDVFVSACFGIKRYRGDGPFLHWLRKIAVRTGYAFWKRAARRRRETILDPETLEQLTADPDDASASEAAELVHHALSRLSPRDRVVLTLLYLEERSVAEIAGLLGWSASMVKVQAWRARKKMKRLLEGGGEQ